jgi:hypothetical protein
LNSIFATGRHAEHREEKTRQHDELADFHAHLAGGGEEVGEDEDTCDSRKRRTSRAFKQMKRRARCRLGTATVPSTRATWTTRSSADHQFLAHDDGRDGVAQTEATMIRT